MDIVSLREYCLSIKGTEECMPFDDEHLVFKIFNKMYALVPLIADPLAISVKCNPEKALELREQYKCVEPAYHFNKKYWNTIYFNKDMKDDEIREWINHSVAEVIQKLPKKIQKEYFG